MTDPINWTEQRKRLGDLTPWPRNPRQIKSPQAKRLLASVQEFGQVETLAIGPDGDIYNGHQRLAVLMQQYGADYEVDVRVSSRPLSEKEREKLTVYLHKGAAGEWDFDILANEFEIPELIEWGFEAGELGIDLTGGTDDDAEPQIDRAEELREQWGVSTGQMWRLPSRTAGQEHRLICGDCTDAAVVDTLLQGEVPLLMVTDPPYGVDLDHGWRDELGINRLGKGLSAKLQGDDNASWPEAYRLSRAQIAYVWHGAVFAPIVYDDLKSADLEVRQQIIWVKNVAPMGRSAYHWRHEVCWYAVRKGCSAEWIGGHKQTTVWEAPSPKHIMSGSDEEKQPHPTQKPLITAEKAIANHGKPGDIVYEPFSGSGTTIIAAENLSRQCRAIEISPAYCAVALQRYRDAFGIEPELIA